ncbi:MAG: helix-turn-helix domain-containing protein [Gammaproteobacteria bacterium]
MAVSVDQFPPRTDARVVDAVLAVGTAMATTRDHAAMLAAVIDAACRTVGAATGGFMRHDPDRDELVLQAPAFGVHDERRVALYRARLADGGNAARVFLSREPYVANDARSDPRFIQRFVRLFDTYNTVTVPLVLGDRPIGIFHAINKRQGDFSPADCEVLSALAPLLAACLQSALMFRAFEDERRDLERSMQAHERLLDAAIGASDVDDVCAALHAVLHRPVLLLDGLRQPLASHGWRLDPAAVARDLAAAGNGTDGRARPFEAPTCAARLTVVDILLGSARGGTLLVDSRDTPLDAIDVKALEQAGTLVAVEIFKRRSISAAENRQAGALLQALFSAGLERRAAGELLARLGLPPDGPWRVIAIELGLPGADSGDDALHRHGTAVREALERTLGALRQRVRLLHWRAGFVVVAGEDVAARLTERGLVRRLQQALAQLEVLPPGTRLRLGVGRLEADPTALGAALKTAEQAVHAIARIDARAQVMRFEDLGIYRLLLGANRADEHAEFVDHVLAPVIAADRGGAGGRGPLLDTLAALVDHDFALTPTAQALGVHLNTVKYRLNQLRELLGGDPARGELRTEVALALKIRRLG